MQNEKEYLTENSTKHKRFYARRWMAVAALLIIYDVVVINAAYGIALWCRFDLEISKIPDIYLYSWLYFAPIFTAVTLIIFICCKLYRSVWRYVSFNELGRVIVASALSTAVQVAGTCIFFERMPISYYVIGAFLQFGAVCGIRFAYRAVRACQASLQAKSDQHLDRVMVIGAGEAGRMLIREISVSKPRRSKALCAIDDNPNKIGRMLDHVPIVGTRADIPKMAKKYAINKIIIALPAAKPSEKKQILDICKETECEMKILPGITQILNGKATLGQLRDVSVEELLGRDPIKTDMREISDYLCEKSILITGGGGSIGSELARQIATYGPKKLILFDIYENNAYDIQQELKWKHPELNLVVLIGSVRDGKRLRNIMAKHRPDIIYHAAAHKHVPLMEDSPNEAIKNNVLGTYETAMAASKYGVSRFVLISTDKAVNPTNIMGASKRMCEMVVQHMNEKSHTDFVAVRFGNVLGSNGSVIPLFKRQIKAGGPVTVTDPDITRFFMTIPEAVSLVLQAGAYAHNGEIFVLDMGQPVKIDDLARNLIRLSGHIPDGDIKVEYTGLRPGEKLYEELLMAEEGLTQTKNEMIYIGQALEFHPDFLKKVLRLKEISYENPEDIKQLIKQLVPTYRLKEESPKKVEVKKKQSSRRSETVAEAVV